MQRFSIKAAQSGERLDKVLAQLMPEVSRGRLQKWIEEQAVRVNGTSVRTRHAVLEGDVVEVTPQAAPEAASFVAENISIDVVYEDASIIVVDKPPGLVVHPAAGHWSGTLLNGLLAYESALAQVPRAGIVHRLDADTSGLMVVARTPAAHLDLVRQLQARTVTREYWAVVVGDPPPRGTIDQAIARDPRNPLRFRTSRAASAREARTHFIGVDLVQVDGAHLAWLACRLDTGRTHQIRVHLESIGLPIVGDPVYRGRLPRADKTSAASPAWLRFSRQALHASVLALNHPSSGRTMRWFRPPPADMHELMDELGFAPLDKPARVFK